MRTILYGNTGSSNRGCEAIVRSTVEILKDVGISADIATYRIEEDRKAKIDELGNLISYRSYTKKSSIVRLYNGVMKKIFHNEYPYERYIQKDVWNAIGQAGSTIVIGGDTYCYSRRSCAPSYNCLKYAKSKKFKTILWSCSIGVENMDEEKISYLKKYDMIFPRECVTYQNMLDIGIPEEKLFLMSDSAFVLNKKEITLPSNFENVFAYNPSFTLGGNKKNQEQLMNSRISVLQYILDHTDMKIALIPHVYKLNYGDAVCAKEIAQKLNAPDRVFLFDNEYSCEELKYIISKCRMLVAERTHASIAGYSQMIPTFVIGYSVKSVGIANDLFGTDKGYVVSYKDIHHDDDLIVPIMDFVNREEEIRQQLNRVIPSYKNKAINAAKKLSQFLGDKDER